MPRIRGPRDSPETVTTGGSSSSDPANSNADSPTAASAVSKQVTVPRIPIDDASKSAPGHVRSATSVEMENFTNKFERAFGSSVDSEQQPSTPTPVAKPVARLANLQPVQRSPTASPREVAEFIHATPLANLVELQHQEEDDEQNVQFVDVDEGPVQKITVIASTAAASKPNSSPVLSSATIAASIRPSPTSKLQQAVNQLQPIPFDLSQADEKSSATAFSTPSKRKLSQEAVEFATRFVSPSNDDAAPKHQSRTSVHFTAPPLASAASSSSLSHPSQSQSSASSSSMQKPVQPVLNAFTVYMKGYLKQKSVIQPKAGAASTAVEVKRGTAGKKLYFVWHSKGLSVYNSEKDYNTDKKPLRSMLNAWNDKYKKNEDQVQDEQEEELELMMVPYKSLSNSLDSISMLREAEQDELLIRLVLAIPSQLDGLFQLPPATTLMVLKAGHTATAKLWLNASSSIHYAHKRTRQVHTKILPLLHSFLANPHEFFNEHAPHLVEEIQKQEADQLAEAQRTSQPQPKTGGASKLETTAATTTNVLDIAPASPSPENAAPTPRGGLSTIIESPASYTSTNPPTENNNNSIIASPVLLATPARLPTSPEASESPLSPLPPPNLDAQQRDSTSPPPSAMIATVQRSPTPSMSDDGRSSTGGSLSVSTADGLLLAREGGSVSSNGVMREHVTALGGISNQSMGLGFLSNSIGSLSPPPSPHTSMLVRSPTVGSMLVRVGTRSSSNSVESREGSSSLGERGGNLASPHILSPRSARAVSIYATGGGSSNPEHRAASATLDRDALNTIEFYGLNGETPIYPTLPFDSINKYATTTTVNIASPRKSTCAGSPVSSVLVSLDQMGPRRCNVYELFQWILFQFPGSEFRMPSVEAAAAVLSPNPAAGNVSPSPQSPPPAAGSNPSTWVHSHMQYAFLLFHSAFIDNEQLLEWLEEHWDPAAILTDSVHTPHQHDAYEFHPHVSHHLKANILNMLTIWVEYFRRDYLATKEKIDAFLKTKVYPYLVKFEAERSQSNPSKSCEEWCQCNVEPDQVMFVTDDETNPQCINLTSIARYLSSIIALTAGAKSSVIDSFILPPLDAPTSPIPTSPLPPATPLKSSPIENDSADSPQSTRPIHARTVSSPLQRRQSFALARGATFGPTSPAAPRSPPVTASPSLSPSPLAASSPTSPVTAMSTALLHSQAHRPPQCFAHRASSLQFLKKFVGMSSRSLDILSFPPREMAYELTNIDLESLQCIHTRELAHKNWTEKESNVRMAKAGDVLNFIESFNRRSFWVASEILRAGTSHTSTTATASASASGSSNASLDSYHPARLQTLLYFIHVLEELLHLQNFYASFSLINGLSLQPLYRIKALWAAVPRRDMDRFERLKEGILNSRHNFKTYRLILRGVQGQTIANIPNFAILLKDLFQLEELPTFIAEAIPLPRSTDAPSSASVTSVAASNAPESSSAGPLLHWHKFAKQYVELHNTFLLSQNSLASYEKSQTICEAVDSVPQDAPTAASTNNGAKSPTPASPSSPRASVVRKSLPPSDPNLRMCLHLSFQRSLNEDKLFALSYRIEPRKQS